RHRQQPGCRLFGRIQTGQRRFGGPDHWTAGSVLIHGQLRRPVTEGLNQPTSVAVDPAGNLYVADAGNNRVLEYDSPQTNPVANQVFGQSNSFNSASGCNAGGISAASLCLNSNIS